MLHGMIHKQEICLSVRDAISDFFYMFSSNSLATGALILGIIVIADNKSII